MGGRGRKGGGGQGERAPRRMGGFRRDVSAPWLPERPPRGLQGRSKAHGRERRRCNAPVVHERCHVALREPVLLLQQRGQLSLRHLPDDQHSGGGGVILGGGTRRARERGADGVRWQGHRTKGTRAEPSCGSTRENTTCQPKGRVSATDRTVQGTGWTRLSLAHETEAPKHLTSGEGQGPRRPEGQLASNASTHVGQRLHGRRERYTASGSHSPQRPPG